MKTKNKITKSISGLLIISILIPTLFFSQPKQADAQFTDFVNAALNGIGNAYNFVTKYAAKAGLKIDMQKVVDDLYKQTKRVIVKRVLAEMTKSTITWINSNYHGAPLFLENPGSFFDDIAKSEVKNVVNQIGYDRLKFPFGKQFALQAIESYKMKAQQNAEYSLNGVVNDPELLNNYRVDFSIGGWDGFLLNTQYPNNNPIGFNISESAILGGKLAGTVQNKVAEVKDTLQQGMGFLSPQTCIGNPQYNNGINEFNRPSFSFNPAPGDLPPEPKPTDAKYQGDIGKYGSPTFLSDYAIWQHQYDVLKAARKNTWAKTNECPKLVNTTPGKVIAEKAVSAVISPEKQGEIAQLTGDALGAIFDAFFYKLMNDGLNSLKKQNNPPPVDNFSYEGVTLGSPTISVNGNGDPFGGPDEEIILDNFKKQINGYTTILNTDGTVDKVVIGEASGGTYTPGDIDNTTTEIELFDNKDTTNPGLLQLLQLVPKQAQILDECIPGPDKNWESRLEEDRDRVINSKFMPETGSKDYLKVKAINGIMRDLKFAVASFKEWLTTKMLSALPDSILFLDALKDNEDLPQQIKESSDTKRTKAQTLARLKALKINLSTFSKQPVSTDADFASQEKKLVAIRKQYNAIIASISNATSIEDTKSKLNALKDRLSSLSDLTDKCKDERTVAKWGPFDETGRGNSVLNNAAGQTIQTRGAITIFGGMTIPAQTGQTSGTELEQFCGRPIESGYSHGDIIRPDNSNGFGLLKYTFRNVHGYEKGDAGYEDLLVVNASPVYGDIIEHNFVQGEIDTRVGVDISCDFIFKSNLTDYTGSGDPSF